MKYRFIIIINIALIAYFQDISAWLETLSSYLQA